MSLYIRSVQEKTHRTSGVQGPFTNPGLRTFCQRCKHCTSVRSGIWSEIFFQFLPPYCCTADRKSSSSSAVQFPREDDFIGVPPQLPPSKDEAIIESVSILNGKSLLEVKGRSIKVRMDGSEQALASSDMASILIILVLAVIQYASLILLQVNQ